MTQAKAHNYRNRTRRLLKAIGWGQTYISRLSSSNAPNKANAIAELSTQLHRQQNRLAELESLGFHT